MPRWHWQAVGIAALLLALVLQFTFWLGVSYVIINEDLGRTLWWVQGLILIGLFPVVPVGYVACIVGSRLSLGVATACAFVLAAIAVLASVVLAMDGVGSSPLVGIVGGIVIFGLPAWLLFVGIRVLWTYPSGWDAGHTT